MNDKDKNNEIEQIVEQWVNMSLALLQVNKASSDKKLTVKHEKKYE